MRIGKGVFAGLLAAGFVFSAAAQEPLLKASAMQSAPPDNEAILKQTIDSSSPCYYPALHLRYMAGDTTLTLQDYYYLYYGYAFQENYRPLESIPAQDRILVIFEQNPMPDSLDCRKIIEYAHQVMRADPFSPANINFLIYAYGRLGDYGNERLNRIRLDNITDAIRSSGKGTGEKSPWHVLFFSHANDMVVMMGLQPLKRIVVSRSVEFIPLYQKQGKAKGFYFDFSRVYRNRPEARPQAHPGWEFNGIKLNRNRNKNGF